MVFDAWRNQSETIILRELKQYLFVEQAKYEPSFMMLKKSVLMVLHREMGGKMSEKEAMRVIEDPGAFNIYDIVNTYRKALITKQDIHVLSSTSEEYNYEIISKDIAEVISCVHGCKTLIAQAIIKIVYHQE